MLRHSRVYTIVLLSIAAVITAYSDILLRNKGVDAIRIFPIVLVSTFFMTRYTTLHFVYVALLMVLYSSILLEPLFLVLIQILLLYGVDAMAGRLFNRFSIFRVLGVSAVYLFIYTAGSLSVLSLLSLQGWYALPLGVLSFDISRSAVFIVVSLLCITALYPLFANYEAKHKVYLHHSPYDIA